MMKSSGAGERPGQAGLPRGRLVLKVLFGALLLFWLLWNTNLVELRESFGMGEGQYLFYIVLAFVLLIGLQAWRLHLLIGSTTKAYMTTFRLVVVGFFFNNFLPTNVGGDVYKVVYMGESGRRWSASAALVLCDRFAGISAVILVGIGAALWGSGGSKVTTVLQTTRLWEESSVWVLMTAAVLGAAGFAVRRWHRTQAVGRIRAVIRTGWEALGEISPWIYVSVMIVSILAFFARVFRFMLYAEFFGLEISLADLTLVVVFLNLVGLLPLSVGGLGLQEGAIAAGLSLFDVPLSLGAAVAILNRAATWVVALLGGLIWLSVKRKRHQNR